jgi:hypothetical protein
VGWGGGAPRPLPAFRHAPNRERLKSPPGTPREGNPAPLSTAAKRPRDSAPPHSRRQNKRRPPQVRDPRARRLLAARRAGWGPLPRRANNGERLHRRHVCKDIPPKGGMRFSLSPNPEP